jgi:hypothetical protein
MLYWNIGSPQRLCVPTSLRADLLHEFHDLPVSGHVGIEKTYAFLSRDFYWKGMYKDVTTYVNSCDTCQQSKPTNAAPAGLAQPLLIPDSPNQVLGLDLIIGLPPESG